MAYTTADQLETHLSKTFTTAQKTYINDIIIPAVDEWINNFIGGKFDDANDSVVIKKSGGLPAIWSDWLDVTQVKEDDSVVDADDYVLTDAHVVKKDGAFSEGVYNIEITGTRQDVPAAVKAAANYLAGRILQPESLSGATEERYMDYTIKYSGSVENYADKTAKDLLGKYRAIHV